jgi:hypothetical protein
MFITGEPQGEQGLCCHRELVTRMTAHNISNVRVKFKKSHQLRIILMSVYSYVLT